MAFQEPILGGGNALVREEIKSPNFVTGVSGWDLNKDGDAEFNNVTVRGDIQADGTNGSFIAIRPGGVLPSIQLQGRNTTDTAEITADAGRLEFVGPSSSTAPKIQINGPGALLLPNTITIDTTNSTGKIYLQTNNGVQVAGGLIGDDQLPYQRGQTWNANISFASAASNTQTVNFPVAFQSAPSGIYCNINSLSGTTTKWHCKAVNATTTGFTLFSSSGDGTAAAWTNVNVQFTAFV